MEPHRRVYFYRLLKRLFTFGHRPCSEGVISRTMVRRWSIRPVCSCLQSASLSSRSLLNEESTSCIPISCQLYPTSSNIGTNVERGSEERRLIEEDSCQPIVPEPLDGVAISNEIDSSSELLLPEGQETADDVSVAPLIEIPSEDELSALDLEEMQVLAVFEQQLSHTVTASHPPGGYLPTISEESEELEGSTPLAGNCPSIHWTELIEVSNSTNNEEVLATYTETSASILEAVKLLGDHPISVKLKEIVEQLSDVESRLQAQGSQIASQKLEISSLWKSVSEIGLKLSTGSGGSRAEMSEMEAMMTEITLIEAEDSLLGISRKVRELKEVYSPEDLSALEVSNSILAKKVELLEAENLHLKIQNSKLKQSLDQNSEMELATHSTVLERIADVESKMKGQEVSQSEELAIFRAFYLKALDEVMKLGGNPSTPLELQWMHSPSVPGLRKRHSGEYHISGWSSDEEGTETDQGLTVSSSSSNDSMENWITAAQPQSL